MDRIALAKRLESLSTVFASHTPYNRDLKAMSYVLNKMSDDKFAKILSADFSSDVEGCMCDWNLARLGLGVAPEGEMPGAVIPSTKVIVTKKPMEEAGIVSAEVTDKTAAEKMAGMFWSREASKAVVDGLLRDVVGMNKSICCDTGRQLEEKQVPDGTYAGLPDAGVALKPEQTPDIATTLDSKIVEKSHGAVHKEAGSIKGPGIPDGTGPMRNSPECKMNKKDEDDSKEASLKDIKKKKEEDKKAKLEKDIEDLKKANKSKKKASDKEEESEKEDKAAAKGSSSSFGGIELTASMDDVELDANEAAELSKLFQ